MLEPDGQQTGRASPLEGKRLLVVLGSYRSKRHIYEHARDLGVRLVVLDGPGHWAGRAEDADGVIERHLAVDLAPFSTFVERAVAAVAESGSAVDGVGTIDEFAGGFAARIAERLGLSFHTVEAADLARDKHRVRKVCAAAGIPGPRFARIESASDLETAASVTSFPAVLKPVRGVGSVQAFRVRDTGELRAAHTRILAEVGDDRGGPRENLSSDRDWFALMWSGAPHLTLESWIEGKKYDVDLVLDEGRVVYAHATDDLEPCGLRDVRRVAPSGLDPVDEVQMIDHAADCVRAIGFRRGAFNVEVKRTADGPRMIEVNGRLGGYSTTDIHREVWGVDLVEQWLRLSLGLPPAVAESIPTVHVAESLLPAPRSGVVSRDGFLDDVQRERGVVAARPWVFAGDVVAGVETGAPDWLGAVLTRAASRDGALAELDRVVKGLDIPVQSVGSSK
ncbi:MAG: ATP-grasp domain-containing protein [Vicinamibacteria bacterium]|nr:ATP-grasp domain-containing protein [Vicinamibacteria bacterium]